MPGPQVDELQTQILRALPGAGGIDAATESVCQGLDRLQPGLSSQLSGEIAEARERVRCHFSKIELLRRISVYQLTPPWYFGPSPSDFHWPAVFDFLNNTKGWRRKDVQSIDKESTEVVSLLADPRQQRFSCRGLVVGHVQSGKTANMTAVAAKALDAGYNTVIVLAGMTNKLRYQTQMRLDADLVSRHPMNWQVLTPSDLEGDFRAPPHGGFLSHMDKAQLAVIKKNVSPLRQLKIAVKRTLRAVRNKLRILVIDDECDQASINSAARELDMTAINGRIREILSLLPAVTYVGYTATPFANVLINPYPVDGQQLDDLYPKDFITALTRPDSYFGTEKLFGLVPSDADNVQPEEEGLDMIRDVPPDEEALLQPTSRKDRDSFYPEMADSLETAILYFLATCAARHARGDGTKHMTMLVHTSAYVIAHERVASLISHWVVSSASKIVDRTSDLGERVQRTWEAEMRRIPGNLTDAPKVSVDQIFDNLQTVLDVIEFPIENGSSDDRIDYTGEPKTYIVTGGTILARGLTLEGLTVSYFLRSANQYDTLLQMGRWFGYRPRYEDLPRIWMPEDLSLRFRSLATIEQEVRDDIEQYRRHNRTPLDIAVRIRAIPGMAITGANRMRAARRCAVSYWGTHRQTVRFEHRDDGILRANWAAGADLVSRAQALGLRDTEAAAAGKWLWRGVSKPSILRFLNAYVTHPAHVDLGLDMLVPFLEQHNSRLRAWNVGIVQGRDGPESAQPIGTAGTVRMVSRARLSDSNSSADLKALMSKRDLVFDCRQAMPSAAGWDDLKAKRLESVGQVPLLLLYPIDRKSKPRGESDVRIALDAAFDVLGYGIVFPGSVTESGSLVSVELRPLSADDLEIAEEEAAQAEAAGVN